MRTTLVSLLLVAGFACGCASAKGLTQPYPNLAPVINDPNQASRLEKAMTDGDIADLLNVDVHAKLPTSIAVARVESQCRGYQPALATIDAEEMNAWEKAVAGQARITGVHAVTPMLHEADRPTLHSLRVAAARLNCELLLVYLQADSEVDNFNEAAALYWTFVGLWLAPGNTGEHRTVMQAVLVDCRTGVILGTAMGDSHQKRIYAAAYKDIHAAGLSKTAAEKAMADLQKSVGELVPKVVRAAVAADAQRKAKNDAASAGA